MNNLHDVFCTNCMGHGDVTFTKEEEGNPEIGVQTVWVDESDCGCEYEDGRFVDEITREQFEEWLVNLGEKITEDSLPNYHEMLCYYDGECFQWAHISMMSVEHYSQLLKMEDVEGLYSLDTPDIEKIKKAGFWL